MKVVNPITGEIIRRLSQHHGLRPGQLAGKLKLKGPQISQIFAGQKKVDQILAEELAPILKIQPEKLLSIADDERRNQAQSAEHYFDELFSESRQYSGLGPLSDTEVRETIRMNEAKFRSSSDEDFFCVGSFDDQEAFVLPQIISGTIVLTLNDACWVDSTKTARIERNSISLSKGDEMELYAAEAINLDVTLRAKLEVHEDLYNTGLYIPQNVSTTLVPDGDSIHPKLYVRNDVDRTIVLSRHMPIFRLFPERVYSAKADLQEQLGTGMNSVVH